MGDSRPHSAPSLQHKNHALQARKKPATLNTAHSTQPPVPPQATAHVRPIRTPLLPTPQTHRDTNRTRGGEGGGGLADTRKRTRTHSRQTHAQAHTGSASQQTQQVEFPVILTDRGAGAIRFRSLGPWFDGLDFGPGVGRPGQVRPLQGGRWLIACVSAVQQAQISRVTYVRGVPVSCSVPAVSVDGVVRPIPSVRTKNIDSLQNFKHTKRHQCKDYPTGRVHSRSLCG